MEARIKVLYFGPAREITGTDSEEFAVGETSSLRSMVLNKYPRMAVLPFLLALNCRMLKEECLLKDNDIVAILPPFEGG
jgi:molybdopterin converting factor small subunit